jgi:hypothetical protein
MKTKEDMGGWFEFNPIADLDNPAETLGQAVPIITLLDRFDIDYVQTNHDQYKVRCLFHKDGQERNPSMYVYAATSSYHCFSCQANGNIVDLMAKLMGYSGTPGTLGYNKAIQELCLMAGITSGESAVQFVPAPKRKPEETLEYWVLRTGQEIRKHLKTKEGRKGYEGWNAWADARFKRMDKMLDSGDDDQWEKAKKYYEVTLKQIRGA